MTPVPEDIREAAAAYMEEIFAPPGCDLYDLIAQALLAERLAERERCALIAENFRGILEFYDRPGSPPGNGYRLPTREEVAAAIRRQP